MKNFVLIAMTLTLSLACSQSSGGGSGDRSPGFQAPVFQGGNGGDVVGNGGGGVCIADKCTTIAEAGLRVASPAEPYYILPPETVKAIRELSEKLPLGAYRSHFKKDTIGEGENFIRLEITDPAKIETIRKQYADLLKETNSQIRVEDVKIFAFGRVAPDVNVPIVIMPQNQTYLLPDFFLLTPAQQAKVLVHERNVRGRNAGNFKIAVELDGLIQDILQDPNLPIKSQFRIDRWFELIAKFYYTDYQNTATNIANWAAWYKATQNIVFDAAKFCDFGYYNCEPDTNLILENYAVSPSFLRFLQIPSMSPDWNSDERVEDEQFKTEIKNFCSSLPRGDSVSRYLYPKKSQVGDYHLTLLHCASSRPPLVEDYALSFYVR